MVVLTPYRSYSFATRILLIGEAEPWCQTYTKRLFMFVQCKRLILGLLVAACSLGSGTSAWAQGSFKVDKLDPPELSDQRSKIFRDLKTARNRLASSSLSDEDIDRATQWYTGYVLPSTTQFANAGQMGQFRKDITSDLSRMKSRKLHDAVVTAADEHAKKVLAENFVRPDEAEKVKSLIREKGTYKVIDKVSVELNETVLLVLEAEFRNGMDTFKLYVNPTST